MNRKLVGTAALALIAWGTCTLAQQAGATREPAAGAGEQPASAPKVAKRADIYDEKADARQQIAAAVKDAGLEHRRVLVQWGANWCGWCHLLHEKFAGDADIKRTLAYEYDLVLIDVGRFDKNMELAAELGADLKASGLPYLTVLGAEGKPIANQDTGSLETKPAGGEAHTPSHDSGKVLAFLEKHKAPAADAESVLSAALAEAKRTDRKVFLHFGAPWCPYCLKLDAWMRRPEIESLLARDYIDVKIDTDRMTGGKEMLARFGAERKGIPWMAVLDPATGEPVVTSDSAEGNIGFPMAPAEIEHFLAMLEKSAPRLAPADRGAIRESLQPAAK